MRRGAGGRGGGRCPGARRWRRRGWTKARGRGAGDVRGAEPLRQDQREGAPSAGRAVEGQLAAQKTRQIARDREPQPGAAVLPVGRPVGLSEGLEDHFVLVARNADPRVLDVKGDPTARHPPNPQLDAPALGELQRVREQILQHLLQPRGVGHHRGRNVGLDGCRQLDPLVARHRAKDVGQLVAKPRQRDLFGPYVQLAGLDLGEVEDVVDQRQQIVARRIDRVGELDLLRVQVAVAVLPQQLGEDERAVERRPQLVRHVGQELRLVGARALQVALGPRQEVPLFLQRLGLLFEVGVDLLELHLLVLQPRLRVLQRAALLLELFVLYAELLLLRLQLFGLALGLFEQILEVAAILRRPQREADRLAESGEQLEIVSADRMKEAELDRAIGRAIRGRRGHDQVARAALPQARIDGKEVPGHVLRGDRRVLRVGLLRQPRRPAGGSPFGQRVASHPLERPPRRCEVDGSDLSVEISGQKGRDAFAQRRRQIDALHVDRHLALPRAKPALHALFEKIS